MGRLTASSPVPLMGKPEALPSRGQWVPGWHGVGRLGPHAQGPGTFWSQAGPVCTRAMAMVPLESGAPVASVSVCALFVVSKFSAMNIQ